MVLEILSQDTPLCMQITHALSKRRYMTKVVVLGNVGVGKSTLCKKLSIAKGLPVYQFDKLQWNPGWGPTPVEEFNAKHDALFEKDKWIIDAMATIESIEKRLSKADTIMFVDCDTGGLQSVNLCAYSGYDLTLLKTVQ